MSLFTINWSELSLPVIIAFAHFLWQACVVGFVLLVVRRSFSIGLALVSLLTVSLVAGGQNHESEYERLKDGAVQKTRRAVIQALRNPDVEQGSNPIAPEVLSDFPRKLRAIPQQDLVIDSLFNIRTDPPAELDIDERRNTLKYLIFAAPDRLKTLLILITSEFNPELGFKKLLESSQAGSIADRKQALLSLAMLGSRAESVLPQLRLMIDDRNTELAQEVRETIRRIETNDRIVTHAEEADKRVADLKAVALVAENPTNGQDTGALNGRITLDGILPIQPKLRVPTPTSPRLRTRATDEERKQYEASLIEIDDESLQVDSERGLGNAFVYLAKAPSNWQSLKADSKSFTLTMQDYRLEPRAAIVRTSQDLRLRNAGVEADNFGFNPMKNGAQNRMINARSEITLEHPFTSPEKIPIQVKSQMNPWKTTYLLPLDHPFAAITDNRGRFSIDGLPPGEHRFLFWHERAVWLEKSLVVNIQSGQTTEVNRSYSVDRFRSAANQNQTNSNWITAPQVCVGKAFSDSAKAANWKWDEEQRVSLATPESGEMLASCLPGVAADFVVHVRLKFIDDAQCRLTIGEATFDVTKSNERTQLVIANKEHIFKNDDNAREWTVLSVQRRNNSLSIQVNEQPEFNLGTTANAIPKISLQSTRGTIAVNNFVVTGNIQKVKQAQVAPKKAGLQIKKARYIPDTDADQPQSDTTDTPTWKLRDGTTKNVQIEMRQSQREYIGAKNAI